MDKYILDFSATPDNLPIIRHFVKEHLAPYISDPIRLNQLTVATEELCANSIVHGNHSDPSQKLRLELRIDKKTLHIYLYDPAPPYALHKYPMPPQLLRKDTNRPGGLGIYLIRQLMDKITVRRRGKSSVYHLVKNLT
ncbi:MAG: ATP-binding protein [Bacteroidota bacterium]|nr:ATP-binding protein [Bacteroidota bacterium]